MARRRLTPAQPGYLGPIPGAGLETKSALPGSGVAGVAAAVPMIQPVIPPVIPPIAQVSGQSAEAAALREITQGIEAARAEGRMVVEVPLGDIAPHHLARDRMAFDREELDTLKASIRSHGQRVPAEITPLHTRAEAGAGAGDAEGGLAYAWGLISGWRRLRALSELCDETGDARFSVLRALIRPPGEAAASYVAMVEENEIRVGLSYYERARVVAEAAARGVFPDQPAALRTLFATASRAKRSKIASFIDIHEELGDLLHFPAAIPERLGLALVSRLRSGDCPRIRAALMTARPATAAAEIALLERLARVPRTDVSRAKPSAEIILRPGVVMALERRGCRIAVTLSGQAVNDALLDEVRAALRRLGRD
jgi:ParB family transcriptional regulator, chromosome partitioning protein